MGDYGGGQASRSCPDGSTVVPSCVVRAQSNATLRLHVSDVIGHVEVEKKAVVLHHEIEPEVWS